MVDEAQKVTARFLRCREVWAATSVTAILSCVATDLKLHLRAASHALHAPASSFRCASRTVRRSLTAIRSTWKDCSPDDTSWNYKRAVWCPVELPLLLVRRFCSDVKTNGLGSSLRNDII